MASSLALAQDSDKCSGTIKIENQSDADGLSSCQTIQGDIEINESTTGGITFNGIEQITGSLTANGAANITSLAAPQLGTIGKSFSLSGIILLTALNFDSLTEVGTLDFAALPNLQTMNFGQGVTKAGKVSITNTGLTSLNGIDLETVGDFDLTANTALTEVNVNNIKNCTGLLNFAANSNKLDVTFPNLVEARNMTFRNTSSVSVPSLKSLGGQLGLFGNYFTSFSAPNLTKTGDLVFDNNQKLSNISLPKLTDVGGGFQVSSNPNLLSITGLPQLETIIGALDFTGSFTNVSLPSLKMVRGGFNMMSTGQFDCQPFENLKGDVIHGSFECEAKSPNPTSLDGSSGSGSGASSTSTSSGAAVSNLGNAPAMGLTAIVCGLLQLLM